MDTKAVAALLGVKPQTVVSWRSQGCGPPYEMAPHGRQLRAIYDNQAVHEWQNAPRICASPYGEEMAELETFAAGRETVRFSDFQKHIGKGINSPLFKQSFGAKLRSMGFTQRRSSTDRLWVNHALLLK
jgi:hypothetical protein